MGTCKVSGSVVISLFQYYFERCSLLNLFVSPLLSCLVLEWASYGFLVIYNWVNGKCNILLGDRMSKRNWFKFVLKNSNAFYIHFPPHTNICPPCGFCCDSW